MSLDPITEARKLGAAVAESAIKLAPEKRLAFIDKIIDGDSHWNAVVRLNAKVELVKLLQVGGAQ